MKIREERLEEKASLRRRKWIDKRTYGSWRMLLSLKPSFSLCWRSMFSGPERAAASSTSHSLLPYAGQMLNKYRVCLKAGATICLCLSLCCCFSNTGAFILYYNISPSFFFIILLPPPLCLSLPAVHSSLFSGLGGSVTFYPWATRAHLYYQTTPTGEGVYFCFSFFFKWALRVFLCLNRKGKYSALLGLNVVFCGVKLPPKKYKGCFS